MSRGIAFPSVLLLLAALATTPGPAAGGACAVPSPEYPTIQDAADDLACEPISLAVGSYPESVQLERSVTLTGTGPDTTTLDGRLRVVGAGTSVAIEGLGIRNGCNDVGLRILEPAVASTVDVRIEPAALPCPAFGFTIFEDGFESGDAGAWTS